MLVQPQKDVEELNCGRKVYDFMRWDRLSFSLSLILVLFSISIMVIRGFNWGLDFTGGMIIELALENSTDLDKIREGLQNAGLKDVVIQNFGSNLAIMLRIPMLEEGLREGITDKLCNLVNQDTGKSVTVKRLDFVGPSVGNDLAESGSMALLVALLCVFIYVGFRFEWRLATGAVLALVHDLLITLGILSVLCIEIDLSIIASLMSVIGYSLNNSIVVLDRIRENFNKLCCGSTYDILNISLTQVLNRTIITSTTTFIVLLMLLIFGGVMLRGFSIILLISIFIGTFSSLYIASSLALKLGIQREHLLVKKIEKEGADRFFLFF